MCKRARGRVRHSDELLPTAERLAHGEVLRLAAAIVDAEGEWARPYKGLDTLERMERVDVALITPDVMQPSVGADFRGDAGVDDRHLRRRPRAGVGVGLVASGGVDWQRSADRLGHRAGRDDVA